MPEPVPAEILAILYEYREGDLTRFEEMQATMRQMHELIGQLMLALGGHGRRVSPLEAMIHVRPLRLHGITAARRRRQPSQSYRRVNLFPLHVSMGERSSGPG